jgi:bifunctional DNA-binding transcriptional regulator/antitoxin component of YhaV-PrlF toxin-antitoxin module
MRHRMMADSQIQKVLNGGRVTLPLEVRAKLRVKVGDFILLRLNQNHVEIYPVDFGPRKDK